MARFLHYEAACQETRGRAGHDGWNGRATTGREVRYQEEMLMTRKIATGCFAAMFGLAVSAGAQTPSTPQTPSPSTPSTPSSPSTPTASPTNPYPSAQAPAADRAGKEHKLTGCIQAGTSASSFELTNIKKGAGASESAAPADAASKNVKLTPASGVDLAAHVGHTVEVSGSWAKSGDSPSAAAPAAAPAGGAMAKEFSVKNVKMVSSTCSAGTN
jgi:hypothetical protein